MARGYADECTNKCCHLAVICLAASGDVAPAFLAGFVTKFRFSCMTSPFFLGGTAGGCSVAAAAASCFHLPAGRKAGPL